MTLGWLECLGECLQVHSKARPVLPVAVPTKDRVERTIHHHLSQEGGGPVGRQGVLAHLEAEVQVQEPSVVLMGSPIQSRNEEQLVPSVVQPSGIHT